MFEPVRVASSLSQKLALSPQVPTNQILDQACLNNWQMH